MINALDPNDPRNVCKSVFAAGGTCDFDVEMVLGMAMKQGKPITRVEARAIVAKMRGAATYEES